MNEDMMDRLCAAVAALEAIAARQETIAASAETPGERAAVEDAVDKIVATEVSERELQLEAQLAKTKEALAHTEETLANLRASAAAGRKTAVTALAARAENASIEAGALDAALTSLSIEQRIAVKAQMLRSGLLR